MRFMRFPLRRETFIALRARRQGHQIASDILYPEMKSDLLHPRIRYVFQVEKFDLLPGELKRRISFSQEAVIWCAVAAGILALAMFVLWFLSGL
jgi:hypothetical protein